MSEIALLLELTSSTPILPGNNVLFDNISYTNGTISYDQQTGLITFPETGRYSINWWIAVQSSASTNGATFEFLTSEGYGNTSGSPVKTGEAFGAAVFEVEEAGATGSLINGSTATVYVSPSVPVKAGLTVIQLNEPVVESGSAIIPFSSGDSVAVTSLALGLVGLPAFIGFGNSQQGLVALGATIDLFGLDNYSFSMPRDGVLTSLAVQFTATLGLNLGLGESVTLRTEIYRNTGLDNTFAPTGVAVDIPITSTLAIGAVLKGSNSGFNVPVNAGDRLLLVSSITTQGLAIATTLTGQYSAGLGIA